MSFLRPNWNEEYTVLVVGKKGCGKSTVCNALLGKYLFPVQRRDPKAVHHASVAQRTFRPAREAHCQVTLKVIDTAYVYEEEYADHVDNEDKIMKTILEHNLPNILLFVVRCDEPFTKKDWDNYDFLAHKFSEFMLAYFVAHPPAGSEEVENPHSRSYTFQTDMAIRRGAGSDLAIRRGAGSDLAIRRVEGFPDEFLQRGAHLNRDVVMKAFNRHSFVERRYRTVVAFTHTGRMSAEIRELLGRGQRRDVPGGPSNLSYLEQVFDHAERRCLMFAETAEDDESGPIHDESVQLDLLISHIRQIEAKWTGVDVAIVVVGGITAATKAVEKGWKWWTG